jgi:hypothetical protein
VTPSYIVFSWLDGLSWPAYALALAVFMAVTSLGLAFAHVKLGGRKRP